MRTYLWRSSIPCSRRNDTNRSSGCRQRTHIGQCSRQQHAVLARIHQQCNHINPFSQWKYLCVRRSTSIQYCGCNQHRRSSRKHGRIVARSCHIQSCRNTPRTPTDGGLSRPEMGTRRQSSRQPPLLHYPSLETTIRIDDPVYAKDTTISGSRACRTATCSWMVLPEQN